MRISWICHVALNLSFFSVCGLETEASLWQHRLCHGMCCISPVGQYQGFQAVSGAWSQPQVRVCGRDGDTALGFLSMIEHNTKMQGSVHLAWLSRYSAVTSTKEKVEDVVNRLWKHIRVNSRSCVRWRIAAHSLQWRTHDFYCLF